MNNYPFEFGPMEAAKTVYAGNLVWFTPRVTGGKVAARVLDINLEAKTCKLEITATGSKYYARGTVEYAVPFSCIFKRGRWDTPRFSLRWLDYPSARERAGSEFVRLTALVNGQAWNK
jgi:hypothetical protein